MHEMMNDPFLANIMQDAHWQPFIEKMGLAEAQVAGIGGNVTE